MKTENPSGDREDSKYYLEGAKGLSDLKQFTVNANQPCREAAATPDPGASSGY